MPTLLPHVHSSRIRTVAPVTLAMLLISGLTWSIWRDHRAPVSGETSTTSNSEEAANLLAATFRRLIDADGRIQHPGAKHETTAVVFLFLGTRCPISNGLLPELSRLHREFSRQSVEFYGVICDRFASPEEVAAHRREFSIPFPVVLDTAGTLQRALKPSHSPQAVVISRQGQTIYSGRIDDRYEELAQPKPLATKHELKNALTAVVNGMLPAISRTEPVGCMLEPLNSTVSSQQVTFCREIAPIIFSHCTRCHRKGEATPFPLETFEDVRRRANQIAVVVSEGQMPPWKPQPGFGQFLNEQRLTKDEVNLIEDWAANGAPLGDATDLLPQPQFADGWQLGKPDLILELPEEFAVPADGPDIYQHFVLPIGLAERGLVTAFEFRPDDASVVHHAWLYFDDSGAAKRLDAETPEPGYDRFGGPGFMPAGNLGGWGPGGLPRRLPAGMARPIPANSDLVLQVHYHPTGKAAYDRSRVGLYFAEGNVEQLVTQIMVADVDLKIPAKAARHRFEASYTVPVETVLLDATPHMHLLGREIKITATTPDGNVIPLIWIDDWNFYWQDHYVFAEPVRLPAQTRIDLVAWYDNSSGNTLNPHSPPRDVVFGESSDDEMGICYFQATSDHYFDFFTLAEHSSRYFQKMSERHNRQKLNRQLPVPDPAEHSNRFSDSTHKIETLTNSVGMEFRRIPDGEFVMGTSEVRRFGTFSQSEGPARRMRIGQPFWMSRCEVTVGDFRRFVEATGYRTDAERDKLGCNGLVPTTGAVEQRPEWIWSSPGFEQTDQHPVVCVSWNDAKTFCKWLTQKEKCVYRLPTEAEWEYACRAGSQLLFSGGEAISSLRSLANVGDQSLRNHFPLAGRPAAWHDGFAFTAPVGSFQPNSYGLFDMHGNVGEWCEDWFDQRGYGMSSTGPIKPATTKRWRVIRGGSWFNTPTSCRSSGRHDGVPTARSTTNGFRIVRRFSD